MKVKILKTFWEGAIEYTKGDIVEVSNNMGHGIIEGGLGFRVFDNTKEFSAPPKNKMMSKRRKKLSTK